MNGQSLMAIQRQSQQTGVALGDARRAVAALLKRANTKAERGGALHERYVLAMNSGRPHEGLIAATEGEQEDDDLPPDRITDALFWDGDSGAAAAGVRERARRTRTLAPGTDRIAQYDDICLVQQWRLAHGELGEAQAAIGRLRAAVVPGLRAADSASVTARASSCASLLEAWLATASRQPDAAVLVARLDSLSRRTMSLESLVLARLLEAQGNLPGSLAAVRRRAYGFEPRYLSTYLREEGRLATLVGDTAGAIRSYQHYLALRSDPEPLLKPETQQVRTELARLLAEPGQ
jgi:hypothetical protein